MTTGEETGMKYISMVSTDFQVEEEPNWAVGAAFRTATIPYVEDTELRAKGYEPIQLLNYLNFSADLNLGDLFGWIGNRDTLERLWLGYDIHHRSAIFELAQQFGRIKGGSKVQMVYLQYDF
jgi:outer membrane protein